MQYLLTLAIALLPVPLGCGEKSTRVLLLTGGHAFQRRPFLAMFDSLRGIRYQHAEYPAAAEQLTEQLLKRVDVIVTYSMWNGALNDAQRAAYEGFVRGGGGLVALHHALAAHQAWPGFHLMIGGRYFLRPQRWQGRDFPRGTPTHGQQIHVKILDPDHPVTRGVSDFTIRDETYRGYWIGSDVKPLLATDHPKSERIIGWARRHGTGRVVYIQLGHGPEAYRHPAYRRLVRQAIVWAAGAPGRPPR